MRTDLSCTLFLAGPDEYDGGELVVEDTFGAPRIKLPAGDVVLYPGTRVHNDEPATRGACLARFFWMESRVSSDESRRLLFEMDTHLMRPRTHVGETDPAAIGLTGTRTTTSCAGGRGLVRHAPLLFGPERTDMKRQLLIALLGLGTRGATRAQHAKKCDPIPKDEWKPQAELERKLKNEGWTFGRVKIENGCDEVYGKNAVRRQMETFFHPKTFEVVTAPN